ncbi:transcriptional regulator, LysR family [[Leptolyngbya] sp. PCC 7376]|uniref:LysR family transcriptional regulator n=1 Tax=[Leptolyngbya] sp. PCC 7376 TaxID=111781 RepID=UPI00029F27C0|nr:LysR family transcriptional regulator [[Leptolyngbya] sp. PCC 7376]AFY38924.1 transcriptional regulator, LysR family [[Leptolyngbya] sp. PCC 7376]
MRLEQLEAFLAIAATGNFGQAAKQCRVTQSTVSRQIQSLEGIVGTPLFHRNAQVKLTLAGERFLPYARRICSSWNNAKQEIDELISGKQSELCVAAIHSVCAYHLPPVLKRFYRMYPQTQLRITALGSDRALKVLRDNLIDVAIVMNNRFLTASPDMIVQPLYRESIEVLVSHEHPLASHKSLSWRDLANYPQVVFKDGYGMQRYVQEQLNKQGLTTGTTVELNSLDAFRGVVRQGDMLALLPQSALIEARRDPDLVVVPLADAKDFREVVLVTTSDRLEIPPIQYFCSQVMQCIAKAPNNSQLIA